MKQVISGFLSNEFSFSCPLSAFLLQRDSNRDFFLCEICNFLKKTFLSRLSPVSASITS